MRVSMKILVAFGLAAISAASAFAQLAPPNLDGVTLGHIHLFVKDVPTQERFFTEMLGGTMVKNGPLTLIQFPGVYIMLRKADPSGPPAGSVVDHFGFVFKDLPATMARWKQTGVRIEQASNPNQGYVDAPDGIRVEFFGDPNLPVAVRMDHIHSFTTDVRAMQVWYAKVFGGVPAAPRVSTPGWVDCDFMPGEITLSFAPRDMKLAPTKGRSLDHIGFDVKDLDAFAKKLGSSRHYFRRGSATDPRFEDAGGFPHRSLGHYIEHRKSCALS